MDSSQVSFGLAFVAGLLSFLSPCMLPLVPIFLAQLVGQSAYQSTGGQDDRPVRFFTLMHAMMFVLAFTLAFLALGARARTLGGYRRAHRCELRLVGRIVRARVGLSLSGL